MLISHVLLTPFLDLSIYDPERSSCAAEERSVGWMLSYFERRARENDVNAQSQESLSSSSGQSTVEVRTSYDKIHLKYTERDEVLQTLLTRAEDSKTATASSGKKTWVSKWDFNFDKNDKLESMLPVEEENQITSPWKSRKSPNKTRQKSPAKKTSTLPTRKLPLRSIKEKSDDSFESMEAETIPSDTPDSVPMKMSPLKTNNKNTKGTTPSSPYDTIRKPPAGSLSKKRKSPADRKKSKVAEVPSKRVSSGCKNTKQPSAETHTAVVDLTFSDDSDSD